MTRRVFGLLYPENSEPVASWLEALTFFGCTLPMLLAFARAPLAGSFLPSSAETEQHPHFLSSAVNKQTLQIIRPIMRQ